MRDLGLTLAGGGNRSLHQQGLLEAWSDALFPRIAAVGCSSAGAAIITLLLSGRAEAARAHWANLRRGLTRNFDPARLLRGEKPWPHAAIFRSTMLHALAEGGLARLQAAPFPVDVLCSAPPRGWPTELVAWLGVSAYELEKRLAPRRLHPKVGRKLGFRPVVIDARACATAEELADLVLASSSMPPMTPVGQFRGERLIDGGIVDNVPAGLVERHPGVRRNLVLVTRSYPRGVTGEKGSRLYLEPSRPVPIARWDYRESAPVDTTLALGRADAARYAPVLRAFLDGPLDAQSEARSSA